MTTQATPKLNLSGEHHEQHSSLNLCEASIEILDHELGR